MKEQTGNSTTTHSRDNAPEERKYEQNKAIARGYLEKIVNDGNLSLFDNFFADGVLFNSSAGFKQRLSRLQAMKGAFPDHHLTIEDQIAEGDTVVSRVTFHGTHLGEFNGIKPTGRMVTYSGMAMDRISDGKIIEMWHVASPLKMDEQITILLSTPQTD